MVFTTPRLMIRRAIPVDADIALFHRLWNDPRVMIMVGFPRGLNITPEQIRTGIERQPDGEYECKLVAQVKATGELIGECKLGTPDS
ncbi:MAG: GNAT family N-acetyltransferase, partial [candidate division Zixibacteria bacterium]|nr:GNAT family N-acetyltransferase [candidate division Zixibacteria bacterium]